MTDLVLSVVKDRGWLDLDCYALSLQRSGFEGHKVMFADNITEEARINLEALGFVVYNCKTPNTHLHFQTWRYFPALEFLRENRNRYRFTFWTDTGDLVFQKNPVEWMERQDFQQNVIVAAEEGWLIKNQPINDIWIQRICPKEWHFIREYPVLCSGTIQGHTPLMIALFEAMIARFSDSMQGIDQGIYNYVARSPEFHGQLVIPSVYDGFIATVGQFLSPNNPADYNYPPPIFDWETGLVKAPSTEKDFYMVHQYNRAYGYSDPDGKWRGVLESRYRK